MWFADVTLQQLEGFARLGYRTLCVASSELQQEKYAVWKRQYMEATTAMEGRKEKTAEVSNLIEQNLTLLGATAIEDRLQEGVPRCIAKLLEANIKVWVLTGDKMETAINIGHSCNLLHTDMPLFLMKQSTLSSVQETVNKYRTELGEGLGRENLVGLVIDGRALSFALTAEVRKAFLGE